MTPFPEAEIMTIKRLEVALRKMDFKLLKDGAYKLHEKFHSGHKFEYLDLLKDVQMELLNNPSVPSDVRDILSATIDDILSQDNFNTYEQQEKVSPLTSLSYTQAQENETISKEEVAMITDQPLEADYNISKEEFEFEETPSEVYQEAPKINAFDAFSPQKTQTSQDFEQPQRFFTQSPFSAEPFKEFNNPVSSSFENRTYSEPSFEVTQAPTQAPSEPQMEMPTEIQMQIQEEPTFEVTHAPLEPLASEISYTEEETSKPIEEIANEEVLQMKKSVAIVYCQDSSREKIKNILKLKEIIRNSREKNTSIDDLMALISEITTQANTNVIELQGILKQLKSSGNGTSLITNSQSEMLIELLDSLEIDYSFNQDIETDKLKLVPIYGLSNLFYCAECGQIHLDKSSEVKPLVLECPQCKNPMYPDFWAANTEAQLNLENYNKALVELANSKVWLVIHPTFADKTTSELIESALKVSACVEEIYVLDKDINTRENYKNFISRIKPDLKVNAHNNTLEEFFKII